MVERFEKEELKAAAAEGESDENDPEHEKPVSPKDPSLAYLLEDLPTSPETQGKEGILPFPEQEEDDELLKIVKEGVPISHNKAEDPPPPAPKKKVKLIKQEISIAPGENKVPSKKTPSEPLKGKKSKTPAKDQKSTWDKDFKAPPTSDSREEESEDNWVEAEIPGLIMEPPPAAERSESIPTFKASPKAKHQSGAEKSQKSLPKGKQGVKVKSIAPKSEEKKDPTPKKLVKIKPDSPKSGSIPALKASPKEKPQSEAKKPQKSPPKEKQGMKVKRIALKFEEKKDSTPKKHVKIKTDSPELEMEISESKPKAVEIKAPVVSHKNIANKGAGKKKAKVPSSKAGKTQKTEAEVKAVPPQREDIKTSPEKAKPKPFLLDLKYIDQEESEKVDPAAHEKLPADMMDVVIARLHALQVNLENQLVSIPGESVPEENPINGNMREDLMQGSLPVLERTINEPSDKKDASLEELDSFLFTATQRKK